MQASGAVAAAASGHNLLYKGSSELSLFCLLIICNWRSQIILIIAHSELIINQELLQVQIFCSHRNRKLDLINLSNSITSPYKFFIISLNKQLSKTVFIKTLLSIFSIIVRLNEVRRDYIWRRVTIKIKVIWPFFLIKL